MARSGSVDFAVTRDEIIRDAIEDLGITIPGGTLVTAHTTKAAFKLNLMVKRDMAAGLNLWQLSEGTLFLVPSRQSYTLGTGGDHASASYTKTELASAASIGALTIDVDSVTGIATTYVIGIELDSGTIQWTTVNGAPAGTTVTLAAALTGAAAVDNHVYCYQTIIEKPLRIVKDTIRLENSSGSETPVNLVSRSEYLGIPIKSTTGSMNMVYYDRTIDATGRLYTWPTANSVKDVLHFTFERTLQDFDAAADNPDFPIEAADYLVKGLRYELASLYGLTENIALLKAQADEAKEDWMYLNSEDSSIFIQPVLR